ncbi:rhodanese-like domain-containing protein [Cerasicoccus maritimus]|uniref:rhodanese-like domain-containing protein n=1 Tax=Cerasicoccus maritimus TaxID=490089 RepID=UPI002852A027|nr:rhodanese-like domain-containing protein [Cerasicoccus maritimus]
MKRIFLRLSVLLVAPILFGGLNAWLNPDGPPWSVEALAEGEVNFAVLNSWERSVLWVDAREPDQFEQDHIPQALNLSLSHFDEQIGLFLEQWVPGVPVVVYCGSRHCGMSKELANRLRNDFAMDEIYVLKGGWDAWLEHK